MHRAHVHVCSCGNVMSCRSEDCDPFWQCRECDLRQRDEYWDRRFHEQAQAERLPHIEQPLPLEIF